MPLVLNLKKMSTGGQIWLHNQMPFHPSMKDGGGEERRMESWRFIPATAQDPTQPKLGGIHNCYHWISDSGGLRIAGGAYFGGAMFKLAVGPAPLRGPTHQPCEPAGRKCRWEMQRNLFILALGFLFFQHCKMFRILQHANRGIFFPFSFFLQLWSELRNRNDF